MPLSSPIDAVWMFCRTMVAFDRVRQLVEIVSIVLTEEAEGSHDRLRKLYDTAVESTRAVEDVLAHTTTPTYPRPSMPTVDVSAPKSNWTRQGFEDAVRRIKEYIAAGDCFQVVLSQKFSSGFSCAPIEIYRALRTINPSPYMFFLRLGEETLIGASPEMLVGFVGNAWIIGPSPEPASVELRRPRIGCSARTFAPTRRKWPNI